MAATAAADLTILHPPGVVRYRSDLHDAADYGAVGEHVGIFLGLADRRAAHGILCGAAEAERSH